MSGDTRCNDEPSKLVNSISCIMENERLQAFDMERGLGELSIAEDSAETGLADEENDTQTGLADEENDTQTGLADEENDAQTGLADDENDTPFLRIGTSVILSSHVEKVVLNAIIILKQDCDLECPKIQTHHHPSVSTTLETVEVLQTVQSRGTGSPFRSSSWGSMDLHHKKLSHVVNGSSGLMGCSLISILQKIAGGVQHLHSLNKPHGKLAAECVSLSWDNRNHPFIWEDDSDRQQASKEKDICDLGELFYFVLSNGKEFSGSVDLEDLLYPVEVNAKTSKEVAESAKNLIQNMVGLDGSKPIDIEAVLRHPLFWTDEQKINFITELYDSVAQNRDTVTELNEAAVNAKVFDDRDWVKKLIIDEFEKEELEKTMDIKKHKPNLEAIRSKAGGAKTVPKKNVDFAVYISDGKRLSELKYMELKKWRKLLPKVHDNKENVKRDDPNMHKLVGQKFKGIKLEDYEVINEFAIIKKESDGGYRKDSLYDLLRFFRNRKAHYWEADVFQERVFYKAAGGFWNFYSKRYPKLLTFIYDNKEKFPYCEQNNQ